MDIKLEKDFEIKQEELIIKEEFNPPPEPECFNTSTTGDFTTALQRHRSIGKISNLQKYFCVDCPYSITSKHTMAIHVYQFACEYCDFKSKVKNKFKEHLLVHTVEKPHKCKLCDYKATKKSHLKEHILVHTGEKPHQCKLCDYKAARISHLKQHLLVHTGEKPYHCKLCDYKATQKPNLKKHLLVHTDEKHHLFICYLCEKNFKTKYTLTNHLKTHTDEKEEVCSNNRNNEDTKDNQKFVLDPEIIPYECMEFNSMDLVIKEEGSDLVYRL